MEDEIRRGQQQLGEDWGQGDEDEDEEEGEEGVMAQLNF